MNDDVFPGILDTTSEIAKSMSEQQAATIETFLNHFISRGVPPERCVLVRQQTTAANVITTRWWVEIKDE